MKKIKEKLIELLGGVTTEEHKKWLEYKYIQGKLFAHEETLNEMRSIYGMPADKWCEYVYKCIENTYDHYKKVYNDCKRNYKYD